MQIFITFRTSNLDLHNWNTDVRRRTTSSNTE